MSSTETPSSETGKPVDAADLASRFTVKRVEREVDRYFRALVKMQGSDLHMKVGRPPIIRLHGSLKELNRGPIDNEEMCRLLFPMMNDKARATFDKEGGADFAYTVDVDGVEWRFRVNMLQQLGRPGLVARRVNNKIPDFRGLYLPDVMGSLCDFDQGMVLLAGVTGSGKSTTIASMLDYINRREAVHILTLEDPIEFVFTEDKALINQREVGIDVKDFGIGMKHAVREDPDIILVGEMRDEETFMTAIHAAETGHLVFGTLHTNSAAKTIDRIIDVFPEGQQQQIRTMLSESLRGVVAQTLFTRRDGHGRVAAYEIMKCTKAISNLIRENKIHQIHSQIQTGSKFGMVLFEKSVEDLLKKGLINKADANSFLGKDLDDSGPQPPTDVKKAV